ncbi:uncharacterized protein prr36a isoform X2 [Trichomycterus rosablanca]|uniref:uncharacterized protein prr36a isoform X2 n=1 Tax=Trichomycterus rosablanca TaxID=2290929 RepID=UPI002F358D62
MKPDGVATTPADPTEVVVEPENDTGSNGQPQLDQSPPSQPENSENVQTVENSTAALSQNEFNGKMLDPKTKTKVPGKTKPSTVGTKASNASGVASRPATAQGRVPNGVAKAASNSLAKKPVAVTSDTKKTTSFGVGAQPKKGPTASAVEPRTQVKAAERKPVWAAKPAVTSANGWTRPQTASTVQSAASKKPPSTVKPKTTASRPATAPTAKLGVSAAPKAAPVSKATRPTTAPASRSTTSIIPSRSATSVTKSSVPKTTITASSAVLSASSQSSKVSTVGARKDIKTSTSAPVRKPLASTTTRPTAIKTSKPEPPKPGVAAKRLPTEPKTSQTKADETRHVPTRKVQPSPRNTPTRPTARNQQQGGTTPVLKRQTIKPTQSVSPLVIKEKSVKDSTSVCAEPSVDLASVTSVATAEVTVPAESVPEVLVPLAVELEQPDQHTSEPVEVQRDEGVPDSNPSNMDINFAMEQAITNALATETVAEEPNVVSSSPTAVSPEPESKKANDCFLNEAPTAHKTSQEPVIASPSEVLVAAKMSPKGLEVAEKSEQIIHSVDDEEEEEKECSQQVSVSDMSGTQPTEESRPGSAGFAGSVWRAGGLLSELDSEDVSCSQQGASELSAPGVLEGTESMDDLGEASLKGADGDGASVGSPDLEKVPDIPTNEDDDDHVCDMDVGSELADDSHKHGHDNDDDDDVEMASEGITESGLESYGNADEDDFAEDYRLDNLNRMQPLSTVPSAGPWGQANTSPDPCMQPLSTVPSAAPWGQANASPDPCMQPLSTVTFAAPCGQANTSPDPCMKSPQPDPTLLSGPSSNPWQTDSESPTQEPAQTLLGVESANEAPSSPDLPGEPAPRSPQSTLMHELDPCLKQDLTFHSQAMSPSSTLHGNKSMPEELEDFNVCSEINPVSVLPDIAQDLDSHLDQDEVEEPETLPADDKIACLTTAQTSVPSSPLLTTGDKASDTEGEMPISKPNIETGSTGNGCLNSKEDIHHLSASGECEEACVELEGGGGSDTPQSATSGASYGFNSNAHSSTESCTKSPGIFSLENEEQLPDEAKDPSLIKELTLASTDDVLDPVQQSENQLNTEQQYMLCGKVSDELPESSILGAALPAETGLNSIFSSQHQEDWDLDAPHPYFSTISDKTDTSLPAEYCVWP